MTRIKYHGVWYMAALLLLSSRALPAQTVNTPLQTISFELCNNLIFAPAQVNGSGPLWFVWDTGAGTSVLDLERAKSLDLKFLGDIQAGGGGANTVTAHPVKLTAWKIGTAVLKDHTLIALPLTQIAEGMGRPVDGVVGYDFLSRYVVEIDYTAKILKLYDPAQYRYSGEGDVLPFTLVHNHIRVPASITLGDRKPAEGLFTLDTGATLSLVLNAGFLKEHDLTPEMAVGLRKAPGGLAIGGGVGGKIGRIGELRVGRSVIPRPITLFAEPSGYFAGNDFAGILGMEIMHQFRLIIDYPNKKLILEKSAEFGQPPRQNASGLQWTAKSPAFKEYVIRTVAEDTPASEAGLKPGDILLTLDDKPASEWTLEQIRQRLSRSGETCRLRVRRGEETFQVEMKLRNRF